MIKHTREEAVNASIEYFNGDTLAANVWVDKYALKDSDRNIYELTPTDMHRRLAKEFARIESKYPNPLSEEQIFELLDKFKYIVPQGSPMAGIGNNFVVTSISNCFVIDSAIDSYGGIMKTDQEQVQLAKRRGGVGHDLSNLRPIGIIANGTVLQGETGSTLYMERFSNSMREVAQDNRRGALMLSIHVKHPDAERFVDKKVDSTKVTGANISVKVDDNFMNAIKEGKQYTQQFPIESEEPKLIKRINPKNLWGKMMLNAWKSAEPGILFWDTILRESPTAGYGEEWKPTSTNPCGEIPLCPRDSCRLLAINLFSYVINPFTSESYFDRILFEKHIDVAQRMMDDIVDLEIEKIDKIIEKITNDPEPLSIKQVELDLWKNIRQKAVEGRRTGLGITGEGDMLAALGLIYGTPEANDFSVGVHKCLAIQAYKTTIDMAKERGCFPIFYFDKEFESDFLKRIFENSNFDVRRDWEEFGRRNISLLTIAPTGTTSLMTQTTSGIEPVFMPFYKRRRKTNDKSLSVFVDEVGDMWEEYFVFHHKFVDWSTVYYNTILSGGEILNSTQVRERLMSLSEEELEEVYSVSPYYKATANDISWQSKVEMQGRIQKWIDHSISVTTNLPSSATVEDVDLIYMTAWESGCKGHTIYRDGCRSGVLLSANDSKKEAIKYVDAPKRPKELVVDIYTKTALGKNWTTLVGLIEGRPYEVFAFEQLNPSEFPKEIEVGKLTKVRKKHYRLTGLKDGKEYVIDNIVKLMDDSEQYQTRDFSRDLRHGVHPKFIIDDIDKSSYITSFRKVVSRVLKNYLTNEDIAGDGCPVCGEKLKFENGCKQCLNPECNWSACG